MEFENPKLFVGAISAETNEATLKEHFNKYGDVKNVLIIPHKLIGFVTFSDSLMAKNALQEEHIILGKKVDVKPAKPRAQTGNRKIFVGGLPPTITEEEFKEYFGTYGTITDAVVIYDKESHRFRGFGFVTFDSEEAAENVLQKNYHELNNKMVEVKRAKPKEKMITNNIECHDNGPVLAALPSPWGIYDVNSQPCYVRAAGVDCYYYYPCFPPLNGYEPGIGSHGVLGQYSSYAGASTSTWINW
ncbi:hypothetical protein PTKIN_Ptkin08bG0126600 [Pterospermum kingtungense]